MRGSIRIATLFGIPVHVHWSFGLLFLFVIYVGKSRDAAWSNIALFGLFILALFICVLLHEFGHALSARYYGVNTRDITILPIGGVARLDKLPEKPFQEFVVAIAGPAVNVVIYAAIALFLSLVYALDFNILELLTNETEEIVIDPTVGFLATLMQANLMLVVFNMIPAFPMDGGRVFRALLSIPFGRLRATQVAAGLGQIIAIGFLIYATLPAIIAYFPNGGLFDWLRDTSEAWQFQPVLALISFFIFFTARTEAQQVRTEQALQQHTVAQVMRPLFTRLQTSDAMHQPIQELSKGFETNFLVFDDTQILRGVLNEDDITVAMKKHDITNAVSAYTNVKFEKTTATVNLKQVYDTMFRAGQYMIPVFETIEIQKEETTETVENLIGVVDLSAIENFVRFQSNAKRKA